jgi:hypothetical protein
VQRALFSDGHVGVAAKRALFETAVVDANEDDLQVPIKLIRLDYFFIVNHHCVEIKEIWEFFDNDESRDKYFELLKILSFMIEEFTILKNLFNSIIDIDQQKIKNKN